MTVSARKHGLHLNFAEGAAWNANANMTIFSSGHQGEKLRIIRRFADWLADEPNDVIMFVDAFDTQFFGGEGDILEGVRMLEEEYPGKALFFNAESVCSEASESLCQAYEAQAARDSFQDGSGIYLNCGVIIGRVFAFRKVFDNSYTYENHHSSDQSFCHKLYFKHEETTALDRSGILMHTRLGAMAGVGVEFIEAASNLMLDDQGRLHNKIMQTNTIVLQAQGNATDSGNATESLAVFKKVYSKLPNIVGPFEEFVQCNQGQRSQCYAVYYRCERCRSNSLAPGDARTCADFVDMGKVCNQFYSSGESKVPLAELEKNVKSAESPVSSTFIVSLQDSPRRNLSSGMASCREFAGVDNETSSNTCMYYSAINRTRAKELVPSENGTYSDKHFSKHVNGMDDYTKWGTVGCFFSHLSLWEDLQLRQASSGEDLKPTLIIEDDVYFQPDWKHRLVQALEDVPKDWDILKVCYQGQFRQKDHILSGRTEFFRVSLPILDEGLFYSSDHYLSTCGYIVRPARLQTVIQRLRSKMLAEGIDDVDVMLADKELITYILKDSLIYSDSESPSDRIDQTAWLRRHCKWAIPIVAILYMSRFLNFRLGDKCQDQPKTAQHSTHSED